MVFSLMRKERSILRKKAFEKKKKNKEERTFMNLKENKVQD